MPSELSNGRPLVNGVLHGNSKGDIGWIVQKFGGTSVGKFAEKIAEDVVA
jgi:aspartate kinase